MPNKTSSIEWLRIAFHDIQSASILYAANHYTDSIGNDLQQALEKILKSIPAYNSEKIKKSHDLVEIYETLNLPLELSDIEIRYLDLATDYFREDRYPNPHYCLPPREEIKEVLYFTNNLFYQVCTLLNIDPEEVKQ
ncbi:MAG: HEPN domain-containing protein [Campylobacterota bacterium]|nr:HEPN domain-containing protein [Campylobacterota bacterium]